MRRMCGIPGFGNLWTTLSRNVGSLFQRICGDLWSKQLSCRVWTQPSLWFVTSSPFHFFFIYFIPVFLLHYLNWFFPILLSSPVLFHIIIIIVIYLTCIVLSTFILYLFFTVLCLITLIYFHFTLFAKLIFVLCIVYCLFMFFSVHFTLPYAWGSSGPLGAVLPKQTNKNILPLPIFLSPIWITLFP
jgi:hypothetical protein